MKLDVPFYPMSQEQATYCGQFVLKSVFKYFLGKEYDLDYLAKLSDKFAEGYTLTSGLAYAGVHEGLNVKFITKEAELVSDKEVKVSKTLYENKDISDIKTRARSLLEKAKEIGVQFEVRELPQGELEKELQKGNPIIVVIDHGKIINSERQIFHFVLLTGYDDNYVYYHDVGPASPTAHRAVKKELFFKAWDAPGTDRDTVIFSKI